MLSDKDLAGCLKASPTTLTQIRKGNKTVPARWILDTFEQRSVSSDWLWTGLGEKFFAFRQID